MSRDSKILKASIVLITAAFAFTIIYQMVRDQLSTSEGEGFEIVVVVVDKKYSKSSGILVVSLQNLGTSLDNITEEDFRWYLNGSYMGTIHSIHFAGKKIGKWDNGQIIQVELKTEEDLSSKRIKLAFRGIPIIFSV